MDRGRALLRRSSGQLSGVPSARAGGGVGPRLVVGAASVVLILAAVGAALGLGIIRPAQSTPTAVGPVPRYVDVAASAGLAHTYDGGPLYAVGGGLATFDCDDDGRPELYLAGGAEPAALFRNASTAGAGLRFERRPDPVTDRVGVNGAYPIDIDADGRIDLAVLRVGGADLLRGLGGCRFDDATEAWGFEGGTGWTTAFSATWEGDADLPTLALGRYLRLDETGAATPVCEDNGLYRPASSTGYGAETVLTPGHCSLSMLFSDWSGSGRADLRISNDRQYYDPATGEEQLWRIVAGEPPRRYETEDGWVRVQIEGMGIASQDVTGDGLPEVFLTSQADNKLQTLLAGPDRPTYRDIGAKRGVNAAQPFTGGDVMPSTAWHPQFDDVNDDGFMDLFISKGNVSAMPEFAMRDPSNLLLGQPDGTFVEAAEEAGVLSFERGRGAALVDLDLDGLLDLVEVNVGTPTRLWHNVGGGTDEAPVPIGHWLAVAVRQDGPNRDAIGGWLDVRIGGQTTTRELTIGGGHISGRAGWIHAGLGPAAEADVRVRWPDGAVGPWMRVAADGFVIIDRDATAPIPWRPED